MKVSVVVPVYNEERLIAGCLRALFSQIEPANEVILVDNNCTDRSMKIAKKFPVRIVKEKRQGISYARNAGFDAAKYEIIARVDADVKVTRNWCRQVRKSFTKPSVSAVAGTVDFPQALGKLGTNVVLDFFKLMQLGKGTLFGLNMAIRRSMWQKVRSRVIMDNRLVHEDMDLAVWVWKAGGRVVYNKNLVVVSSARRIWGNPRSFFIEYPTRAWRTIFLKRSAFLK